MFSMRTIAIGNVEYVLTSREDGMVELVPNTTVQMPDIYYFLTSLQQPDPRSEPQSDPEPPAEPEPQPQLHTEAEPRSEPQPTKVEIREEIISLELQGLLDNMPRSIPALIEGYNNSTRFEASCLSQILRMRGSNINHLLEFYMHDIYPGDYHFGIKFALAALAKHKDGKDIFNKIKNRVELSNAEGDIIDFGGHSGCSFGGLIYWLRTIFTKAQGDAFDNYHLVFDEGDFQRTHYLFLD